MKEFGTSLQEGIYTGKKENEQSKSKLLELNIYNETQLREIHH